MHKNTNKPQYARILFDTGVLFVGILLAFFPVIETLFVGDSININPLREIPSGLYMMLGIALFGIGLHRYLSMKLKNDPIAYSLLGSLIVGICAFVSTFWASFI
jgi:hypothetical protein